MTIEEDANDQAFRIHVSRLSGDETLVEAAEHLLAGRLGQAEQLSRAVLKRDPTNINAICMLADIGVRVGALSDAEKLLNRCLQLQPDFTRARVLLANANLKRQRFAEALEQLDELGEPDAGQLDQALLRANIYSQTGRHKEAIEIYERLGQSRPKNAGIQMSLAHALKTIGRQSDAITAYQCAAKIQPTLGDAYWSLANLKTYKFDDEQIAAMKRQVSSSDIGREDFFHLCFALGKALEDREEYDDAFWYYQRGNVVRRGFIRYDGDAFHQEVEAQKHIFSPDIALRLESIPDVGNADPIPIFIVGLPRAGSTLVEQILASHSLVEGTQELPDIISIARRLSGKQKPTDTSRYPELLSSMSQEELSKLGEEYLKRTEPHRSGKPFFIDKMPNNFLHVGLIRMILPRAIIVDARRNPMDCCFSCYKQLFARGQNFTYSLTEVGRYYSEYVGLMRHWQQVFPGKIIRVLNEDVIRNPHQEITRLLELCGLPFEQACLSFHQTKRAVKTASSEQVRQPVNSKGVDRWKHYDKHLDPLKDALGPIRDTYRQ